MSLALGGGHSCAVLRSGQVACWGLNVDGQLGLGRRDEGTSSPERSRALRGITSVALGGDFGCALEGAGRVFCWGRATYGQLGEGSLAADEGELHRLQPTRVTGLEDVAELAAGGCHVCARTRRDEVWCWGRNHHGQLGDGTRTPSASPLPILVKPQLVTPQLGSVQRVGVQ